MESLNGVNAITIVFAALCIFAIAYRFYGLWVAQKVLNINAARETPANRFEDGKDYVPTNKYVLFGHHFAAIAAAGPLLGPVLAAQFGYLPGLLWILIGCVLAGGVHDMVVLFCSVRHRGKSLAYIASQEIDTTTGRVAAWAVLAILLLTLAGLSIAVVNAMHNSLWSTYTVFCTIPIAVLMGLYMQVWRKGDVRGATIMGVVLLFLCILSGPWVASHPEYFGWLDIDKPEMSLIIPAYGFLASVLPVWLLLLPRDYLDQLHDRSERRAGHRHRLRDAYVPHAGHYGIHPRRRPDHRRSGYSVPLYYHRLRCAFGLPCHYRHGHDAEDDQQ